MKRILPRPVELAIFFGMALLCTIIVAISSNRASAIGLCTGPIFLASCLMGFRHNELGRASADLEDADDTTSLG
jgi:hypothetical protein